MHRAERVGHIQLCHGGEGLGKRGIILRFARLEAGIFKQHDLAALERRSLGSRVLTDDVVGEDDGLAQEL